jgi:hypothetical protein
MEEQDLAPEFNLIYGEIGRRFGHEAPDVLQSRAAAQTKMQVDGAIRHLALTAANIEERVCVSVEGMKGIEVNQPRALYVTEGAGQKALGSGRADDLQGLGRRYRRGVRAHRLGGAPGRWSAAPYPPPGRTRPFGC